MLLLLSSEGLVFNATILPLTVQALYNDAALRLSQRAIDVNSGPG